MILYFVIGKRKSGTSLLFNSTTGVWTPALKDRSWDEVHRQVKDFKSSKSKLGLIAKADALLDLDKLLEVLEKYSFIDLVVVDREVKQRFLSYVYHRAKLEANLAVDMLGFYEEESTYNSNLKKIDGFVSVSYSDLVQGGSNFFLSELGYVQSENRYNSSRSNWFFYGSIRSFAQSSFYRRIHAWKLIKTLKYIYFKVFRAKSKCPYGVIYTNSIEYVDRMLPGLAKHVRKFPENGLKRIKLKIFLYNFFGVSSYLFIYNKKYFYIFDGVSTVVIDDKNILDFYNDLA